MPSPPPPQRTPWASVVRGGDSENTTPTAAEVEEGLTHEPQSESVISTQDQDEVNVARSRRPVWNRPNNVVVEAGESVMGGAVAWPALSESARTGGSRQVAADGSASASSTQAPILSQPPQRSANNNGTHGNSTGNNSASNNRQRSRNRGGGGGNRPSAPITQPPPTPPPPPPQPIFPIYERPYLIPASAIDAPIRSQRPAGGSPSQMGSEHASSQRNNSRRGNYNPRPRGDGSFHNNHGNRRDQDRRGFHPTPLPLYVHPPPVGYMPPPPPPPPLPLAAPGATSFMVSPQQMRAFPIFGVEMPPGYVIPSMPPDPYRPTMPPPPPPPPPPPMLYPPANENSLESLILNQINYYFSDYNLATDDFLRSNMDDSGWVPISLIASFRRVQILTNDIQVILNALRDSPLLEIQGDKVRRRSNWIRWLPSSGSNSPNPGSSQTLASASEDASSKSMQNMSLDDSSTSTHNGEENNATESHYKLRLANGENASEADHLIGV